MWHERDAGVVTCDRTQPFQDFGLMAVIGHRVSLKTTARLAKPCRGNGLARHPAGPRLGIGNEPLEVHQVVLEQWQEPSGRGIGWQPGLATRPGVTGSADYGNAHHELVVRPFYITD